MKNQISFNDVISGYNMSNEDRISLLCEFKDYLLTKCRKNSKNYNAICRMNLDNLPQEIGIFNRLVKYDDKVRYIVGQYEPSEMNIIRNRIAKDC